MGSKPIRVVLLVAKILKTLLAELKADLNLSNSRL
jgi:hypothetical protein